MGRPAGVSGADTMRAIRKAAIARIYRHGFEAMNLRDLAADVKLRVGSLYNHIPQKQEFLATLLEEILLELMADLEVQVTPLKDPRERLMRFVQFHIEWHTARKEEVFIGNMELRSLSEPQYSKVVKLRKQYEAYLRDILVSGAKAGLWRISDPKVASYAMLAMLTGISNWYHQRGRLSQVKLIQIYQQLVAGAIGLDDGEQAVPMKTARGKAVTTVGHRRLHHS